MARRGRLRRDRYTCHGYSARRIARRMTITRISQKAPKRPLVTRLPSRAGAKALPQFPPVMVMACPTRTPKLASNRTSSVGSAKRRSKRRCTCRLASPNSAWSSEDGPSTKSCQRDAPTQNTAPSSTSVIMTRLKKVGPSSWPVYWPLRLLPPSAIAPGLVPGLSVGTVPSGRATVKRNEPLRTCPSSVESVRQTTT